MATKTQAAPARQSQPAPAGETEELDYTPKRMSARESLIVTLKLAVAAAAFLGLLWVAHVRLEK